MYLNLISHTRTTHNSRYQGNGIRNVKGTYLFQLHLLQNKVWMKNFSVFVCLFTLWDGVTDWGKVQSVERYMSEERKLVPTGKITSDKNVQHRTLFQNWPILFKLDSAALYSSQLQILLAVFKFEIQTLLDIWQLGTHLQIRQNS